MSEPAIPALERKTLDERNRAGELERLRHSASHVMAAAVLRLWPNAKLDIGPATDEGFYYDFDLPSHRFTPDDFPRIEEEMKKIVKENTPFAHSEKTRDEAREFFAAKGQTFKVERLADIPEGEAISFYQNGEFTDLCAGPHVMRTGNVKAFKLLRIAAAYYRGNEKNPQLQRLYGTAFKNKEELENWLQQQEEAKKRDHRKIGQEMGLFAIDTEFVGPGLPLWLPKGTAIVEELEKLAKETEFAAGYVRVKTPHIAKEKMYLTSGHLPLLYADSMFPPMQMKLDAEDEASLLRLQREAESIEKKILHAEAELKGCAERLEKLKQTKGQSISYQQIVDMETERDRIQSSLDKEKRDSVGKRPKIDDLLSSHRYYLKAMNCPHHHRIFAAEPRSYRDLPLRLAEYGTCYRYEQSGELFGLMRVRSLNMNDAHIYCTPEQFAQEFNAVNEMYLKYFKIFGIEKHVMRFSTHSKEGLGKKYVNEPDLWLKTETMVRDVLKNSGINYVEVPNEAAFYGPKIDVQVWSVIGREFTLATNQVDFAVPAKFGLTYRDKDNSNKTPLCIHRAPLGTHERFIGFLIEHYAGNFPLWLAPKQVRVLPVTENQVTYAQSIVDELRGQFVRAELEFSNDKLQGRILRAEEAKVHTMLVVGQKEQDAKAVAVRLHGKGDQGVKPRSEAIEDLLQSIRKRAG